MHARQVFDNVRPKLGGPLSHHMRQVLVATLDVWSRRYGLVGSYRILKIDKGERHLLSTAKQKQIVIALSRIRVQFCADVIKRYILGERERISREKKIGSQALEQIDPKLCHCLVKLESSSSKKQL